MEINQGIRRILTAPQNYRLLQKIMGAERTYQRFASIYVKQGITNVVFDVGCGPADILDYLNVPQYIGIDISSNYIEHARKRYGDKGRFICARVSESLLQTLPKADLIIMIGVLHHLEDDEVTELLAILKPRLSPQGRFVSMDPCFLKGQNILARSLINADRGQNVRSPEDYKALASATFSEVNTRITKSKWIKYTHYIMECS